MVRVWVYLNCNPKRILVQLSETRRCPILKIFVQKLLLPNSHHMDQWSLLLAPLRSPLVPQRSQLRQIFFLLSPLGSPLPRHNSLLALSMKLWISKDYFAKAAVGKLCCLIAYKVNRNLYLFIAYNVNSNLYRSIVWKQSIKPFTTYKVNQILMLSKICI